MKKALGKGIKAFIPAEYGILKEEKYAELDIEQIVPNPLQPREKFDELSIAELAQSIIEAGVLQPIVVVPENNRYRIIVGERRWRAAQKAGLRKVPVLIRNIPREKELEISLIENMQREELNPIEIALAYQRIIQELGCTQQELAEKVGKDRTSVTNFLRLLKLPKETQKHIRDGKISMGHARAILSIESPEEQKAICQQIVKKNLSVREVEKMISRLREELPAGKKKQGDPDLEVLQEEFLRILGTKVSISGSRNKGVIKLFYFSMDDLNRIYEQIKGASA
ncbi:MAG: ParB/RepB/Spo0J family partition protein [Candidatus Aminicenantales bacterium]